MDSNACELCGHINPVDLESCGECGAASHLSCRFCEHNNPTGSNFCNKCGGQLNLLPCPSCGAVVDVTAKSCYQCHTKLWGRSSESEERRPLPYGHPGRIDGAAALAIIERFYEQERERRTDPLAPSSNAEVDSALSRRGVLVFIGAIILAAIAVVGYYNYGQYSLEDAVQVSVAKSERRDRDDPAAAGPIRRDMVNVKTIPVQKALRAGMAKKAEPVAAKTAAASATLARETPEPTSAPAPKPASATASAIVSFAIAPWGEIYVDGRRRGVNPPMRELQLDPGEYKIEVRNTTFPEYVRTIELEAGAEIRIKHHFP